MRPLGQDFPDYWRKFEAHYENAAEGAFGVPGPMAGLVGTSIYFPETLVAAATTGYELEISPQAAVGLMVALEACAFTANHTVLGRLLRPSLREGARHRNAMLRLTSPLVMPLFSQGLVELLDDQHLKKQPVIDAFVERMTHHLEKEEERQRQPQSAAGA